MSIDAGQAARTKGELTRRSILAAAVARFGRDGYRSTSVVEIARDADVSGSLAYAYFESKEALFLAALDDDVAQLIQEGVASVIGDSGDDSWRSTLMLTLMEAVEDHPLAKRVLAGLEPLVTDRMIDLPALADLRVAVARRIRVDQEAGRVRPDIDPVAIGGGIVAIFISMLMSVIQFGPEGVAVYGPDVLAVFAAAVDPVPLPATGSVSPT